MSTPTTATEVQVPALTAPRFPTVPASCTYCGATFDMTTKDCRACTECPTCRAESRQLLDGKKNAQVNTTSFVIRDAIAHKNYPEARSMRRVLLALGRIHTAQCTDPSCRCTAGLDPDEF